MPKGYWIGHVDIDDPDEYPAYMKAAQPAYEKYGAKFLVRGGDYECVEGQARTRHVVVEFSSYEQALACYNSPRISGRRPNSPSVFQRRHYRYPRCGVTNIMRTLISIAIFLTGVGLVIYSYIGSYVDVMREMERSESMNDVQGPIMRLFDFVLNGGAPQLTNYLYLGAFMIVVGVVTLIVRRKSNDE